MLLSWPPRRAGIGKERGEIGEESTAREKIYSCPLIPQATQAKLSI